MISQMVSFLVCVFFFLLGVETTLVGLFPTSAAHTFNSASLFLHFHSVSRSRLMRILKKKKKKISEAAAATDELPDWFPQQL